MWWKTSEELKAQECCELMHGLVFSLLKDLIVYTFYEDLKTKRLRHHLPCPLRAHFFLFFPSILSSHIFSNIYWESTLCQYTSWVSILVKWQNISILIYSIFLPPHPVNNGMLWTLLQNASPILPTSGFYYCSFSIIIIRIVIAMALLLQQQLV